MGECIIQDEVKRALDEWWVGIAPLLGSRIKSVILSGSATADDFAPATSDIDLYVVIDPPLMRNETASIESWHEIREKASRGSKGYWREVLTVQYLPLALVSDARNSFEFLSIRPGSPWWANCNISPFSRYTVIRHGRCYQGESVTFAPPTETDLLDNIERELKRWADSSDEKLNDTRWVADKINRMARYLAFLQDGSDLSKTQALKRAMEKTRVFSDACRAALRYRQVGESISDGERKLLHEGFDVAGQPVISMIQGLLAKRR